MLCILTADLCFARIWHFGTPFRFEKAGQFPARPVEHSAKHKGQVSGLLALASKATGLPTKFQ
jgi:hypothetical protein